MSGISVTRRAELVAELAKEEKRPWSFPARVGDAGVSQYMGLARVTTVKQMCDNDAACDVQIEMAREPFLMIADPYNPGEYQTMAIYDHVATPEKSGLCWIDVHSGALLVKPDTLIYWK
jgi:hypothetical protein